MQVFVTGATGAVGEGLVRALVGGGHTVVGLTRTTEGKKLLEAEGAEAVIGDMRDDATWRDRAAEASAIIHAGQLTPARVSSRALRRLIDADRRALELLVAAAAESISVLVYTSGYLVYGPCSDGPADEGRATNPYPAVMYKREHEKFALESDLPVVVLRPGAVYGNRGAFGKFALGPTLRGGRARHPGDGHQIYSYIHTDDLGEAYRMCIENPRPGEVYNVVDDEPATPKAMLEALAKEADAKPPGSLPAWLFKLVIGHLGPPLLSTTQATNAKIKSELGWAPRYPTYRDGAAALVASGRE